MRSKEEMKRLLAVFGRYKYVFLVLVVGAALLLWPVDGGGGGKSTADADEVLETAALERKLEKALSRVEGAGTVTVVLTPESGPERVLAQNADEREHGEEVERQTTVVMASKGTGTQEAVSIQQLAPQYRGALVIATGADQPQVRLALTQAVSALTGLGADKISICQGK